MNKILAFLTIGLALSPHWQTQDDSLSACYTACRAPRTDPEIQRQEIINLERETAHAIQMSDATFFRRVYSDDMRGTLSNGRVVNKAQFIDVVQASRIAYETFLASDIQVSFYRETAVATCLWSILSIIGGQRVGGQLRVTHVYVYGPRGWRVVTSQVTPLPSSMQIPI